MLPSLFLGLCLLLTLFVAPNTSATLTRRLDFTDFTADYYLTKTDTGLSELRVREVLTIDFPEPRQNGGIVRLIPRTNQNGQNKIVNGESSLNLTVTRNGMPEEIREIAEGQDNYTVYIGNTNETLRGAQVYTFEYSFSDVITEFNDNGHNVSGTSETETYQQFIWDLGLDDWHQSFNHIEANLHLPEDVLNNLKSDPACQVVASNSSPSPNSTTTTSNSTTSTSDATTSASNSAIAADSSDSPTFDNNSTTSRCDVAHISDGLSFRAENFDTNETMQITADFVPNTFSVTLDQDFSAVILLGIELIVGGGLLLFFYYRWFIKARRQQRLYKRSATPLKYLPPKNVSVAEAAIIYRQKPKTSYAATLLEMTVAGKISVQRYNDEWDIVVRAAPSSLPRTELEALHILANRRPLLKGSEIPVERHAANRDLALHALQLQDAARAFLVKKGFLKAQKSRRKLSAFAIIFILILIWGGLSIYSLVGDRAFDKLQPSGNTVHIGGPALDIVCIALFVIILAVIIYLYRRTKTYQKYTLKGIRLALYLDGLEEFLQLPEFERLSFLKTSKKADLSLKGRIQLCEQLLPWACLFGVEKTWGAELAKYYAAFKHQSKASHQRAKSTSDVSSDDTFDPSSIVDDINLANLASQINNSMEQSTYYANRSNKD